MEKETWVLCPVCKNKTRTKVQQDTVLLNFPLFCPKCKQEHLIEIRNMQIVSIRKKSTYTEPGKSPRMQSQTL